VSQEGADDYSANVKREQRRRLDEEQILLELVRVTDYRLGLSGRKRQQDATKGGRKPRGDTTSHPFRQDGSAHFRWGGSGGGLGPTKEKKTNAETFQERGWPGSKGETLIKGVEF